jgi:hypothetical protein
MLLATHREEFLLTRISITGKNGVTNLPTRLRQALASDENRLPPFPIKERLAKNLNNVN